MNLATENPDLLAKSYEALVAEMNAAHLLGAKGVIFHLGSHKGAGYEARFHQVVEYCAKVVEATPDDAWLILENSAGMGGSVGSKFVELGTIIKESGATRIKVCLDTQHAFASGYDLKSRDGIERVMEEFDREVGIERLAAVHANDSKCPLGGGLDRHENIGARLPGRRRIRHDHVAPGVCGRAIPAGGAGLRQRRPGQGKRGRPEGPPIGGHRTEVGALPEHRAI